MSAAACAGDRQWVFLEHDETIDELAQVVAEFQTPELIDDGNETAPSKRIAQAMPEFAGQKATAGPLVAGKIGLSHLRVSCPHFGA
jgi:hypothetical protein